MELRRRLAVLDTIKKDYCLDTDFYMKLRKAIRYDLTHDSFDKFELLKNLPPKDRLHLASIMQKDIISLFEFFQKKPNSFVCGLAPLLKHIKVSKDDYIYKKGSLVDGIYFLTKGNAGLVLEKQGEIPYVNIEPGLCLLSVLLNV
jgi:hypothetical protein